jgi:hypothetical protein
MDLAPIQHSLLDQYAAVFDPLIGDRRTKRTFRGIVEGIIGAESLICSRIAAFSPCAVDEWPQRRAAGEADGQGR